MTIAADLAALLKEFREQDGPVLVKTLGLEGEPTPLRWNADSINASLGTGWEAVPSYDFFFESRSRRGGRVMSWTFGHPLRCAPVRRFAGSVAVVVLGSVRGRWVSGRSVPVLVCAGARSWPPRVRGGGVLFLNLGGPMEPSSGRVAGLQTEGRVAKVRARLAPRGPQGSGGQLTLGAVTAVTL